MSIVAVSHSHKRQIELHSSTVIDWSRGCRGLKGDVFSFRLSTEEGIFRLSRYFATVRRATTIWALRRRSTITSSDKTSPGFSSSIIWRIRWRTASAEWAWPESEAMDAVKKYFISKRPRGV